MKKIELQSLTLRNFKGIKELIVNFNPTETFISGKNGTGKTTVFDAFNWLLWGKNSENQTDFEIKTLDKDNNPIHELEHEVHGILLVDGVLVDLRRVYSEKWTKKHGNEHRELTGHKTDFYINDVPAQLAEYKKYVNDEIIPDNLSRLLTDPLYFNVHLDWNKRRSILTEISGDFPDKLVIESDERFQELQPIFDSGKTLDQKKAEISPKIKKMKDDLKLIPARIDEVNRTRPETVDVDQLKQQIEIIDTKIKAENDIISDVQRQINEKHEKNRANLEKIQTLKTEIQKENAKESERLNASVTEAKSKRFGIQSKINEIQQEKSELQRSINTKESKVQSLTAENLTLKNKFFEIKGQELKKGEVPTSCNSCGTPFTQQYLAQKESEIVSEFNKNQVEKLSKIKTDAENNNETILSLNKEIEALKVQIDSKTSIEKSLVESLEKIKIPELKTLVVCDSAIFNDLKAQIAQLETQNESIPEFDKSTVLAKIKALEQEKAPLLTKLQNASQIERIDARIAELKGEQKMLSQEIATLERIEYLIAEFVKAKIQKVEDKVNSLFIFAKFKMFDMQVNGQESPTCICMHNGVPFPSVNNAMRPNLGLDIIRTMQEFYQIKAPIFIDNRESISEIIETGSQIVNLVVNDQQNELVIN
jgi:DNA repair exonuclease SbcCD ATPase subunit